MTERSATWTTTAATFRRKNTETALNARSPAEILTATLMVKKEITNGETTYRPHRFRRRDADGDIHSPGRHDRRRHKTCRWREESNSRGDRERRWNVGGDRDRRDAGVGRAPQHDGSDPSRSSQVGELSITDKDYADLLSILSYWRRRVAADEAGTVPPAGGVRIVKTRFY